MGKNNDFPDTSSPAMLRWQCIAELLKANEILLECFAGDKSALQSRERLRVLGSAVEEQIKSMKDEQALEPKR